MLFVAFKTNQYRSVVHNHKFPSALVPSSLNYMYLDVPPILVVCLTVDLSIFPAILIANHLQTYTFVFGPLQILVINVQLHLQEGLLVVASIQGKVG
jgi:hypothetical protein